MKNIIKNNIIATLFILTAIGVGIYLYAESRPQESLLTIQTQSKNVYVKYRESGSINVNDSVFEYQDTSNSSFVGGAWYDQSQEYMIIKLQDTYYHYCDLPQSEWNSFKKADSFGSFYNSQIKGNYSCQYKEVPSY